MNVKQLIVGLFRTNAGETELEAVRESGVADGRLAATAYVDGFLDEAGKVFQERLTGFQIVETIPTETKLITKKSRTR